MTGSYTFGSSMTCCGMPSLDYDEATIKREAMCYGASWDFIQNNSRVMPLTWRVARLAAEIFGDCAPTHMIIDTRVHMLMPGWYPCIPGWHHDDVARTRSDGQPNYDNQPYFSTHVLFVANSHLAPTEFAIGSHALPAVPLGQKVYQTWHPVVEAQIAQGVLNRVAVPDATLVEFDWATMHRGVPATGTGWRYFFRATVRYPRPRNEIRTQVQVYVPGDINAGW